MNICPLDNYIRVRTPLSRMAAAVKRGEITIGFIGGSITEPTGGHRWSDKVVDWFVYNYPGLIVNVENAAKGATGSLSAVFRMDEDIMPCGCDIVFIETAVNDGPQAWGDCREGMLRKLLSAHSFDLALAYTYCQGMYDAVSAHEMPDSVADWERLAEYYGISSVFCGQYGHDLVEHGLLRWDEWLPGGLHPEDTGSRVYAEPVTKLAADEIEKAAPIPDAAPLPAPLSASCWEKARLLPLKDIERIGPWRLMRERRQPTADYILYTPAAKAGLAFEFEGRGIVLRALSNNLQAAYKWRVDGGDWVLRDDEIPDWGKNATDWIREFVLTTSLEDKKHRFEIETCFASGALASNFNLCMIGIVR